MTFSSISFLFYFLPIFIGIYFISPFRNVALLAGSLIFYAWGEPVLILLLLISLMVNHGLGRLISARRQTKVLVLGVVLNLLALGVFKYAGFLIDLVEPVLELLGAPAPDVQIRLPIGISFYTFQAISLLIDLHRRDAPPPRGFVDTALYISMFPQLIAGPIVRYKTIAEQLRQRRHSVEGFADGARVFILGLAQKVLLANTFAEVADAAFAVGFEGAVMGELSMAAAWVGLAAYSLQIYFDFAGYSNMAIGMGRMFGFELPRNFNYPYVAESITEFWRRWHITLSQWFRDYVYIPLGGNRVSRLRTYLNLWIVFLLCGLWHGAALTFVFWGAFHGAFLVLERAFLGKWLMAAPRLLRHIYLPLVVGLGWVPFRTNTFGEALSYYAALAGMSDEKGVFTVADLAPKGMVLVFMVGLAAAFWPLCIEIAGLVRRRLPVMNDHGVFLWGRYAALQTGLAILFVACAAALAGGAYNPFIYFRF